MIKIFKNLELFFGKKLNLGRKSKKNKLDIHEFKNRKRKKLVIIK